MEEKQGIITEIIFHNEDNGYTIAVMETEAEYFTVVGCLPSCVKGSSYKLRGTFKVHPTYGEQFAFTEFEEMLPTGKAGIEGFLASGVIKGIGPKMAAAIVNLFGEETLEIMEHEPEKLSRVSGIGPKKAESIAESFAAHREFANVSMFFQEYGVSADYALKLYKIYGASATELIKENPYRLVEEVYGIGFRKADTIAEKMGIEKESTFRIHSGIKYGLSYYVGEGNTYMPQQELCEKVAELLDVSTELIYENMVTMAFEGDIQIDSLDGQTVVYLYLYYLAEQKVCKNIAAIAGAGLKALSVDIDSMIKMTEGETGIILSEQQITAVKSSLTSGVSVITGGPGTGKTTIINTIINIFEQSEFKVAIAAPTGRAAKRITETSGHYASTVHRLLEYYYCEGEDVMKFGKTSEDPLNYDVVIVDEASMIDLMLMQGLTDAIKPGTRLIIVGDYDQLPSVGAGNVLRDIIESEYVHTVILKEIFRQAEESMIVVNAHRINKGEYPFVNGKDKDFFLMERPSEKAILDLILELITKRLAAYYEGIVPVRDIQVLTPVRKGALGSISLNKELQQALNPPRDDLMERKFGEKLFRENDKVMQIKNNYQMGWKKRRDFSEGQGIFNGDVGFIEKIDKEFNQMTVIFDEDKYVTYDFSQLDELELAYAVTVHKSQGSEFPIVVMPISWFPPVLATRNLLYTAVTRGKQIVVLVGSEGRMNAMIDNNRIKMRYSGLRYRLENLLEVGR
ncbi:ATP-dependent RecD-like DNA helicase [Emergencia timonensis]|uniref:SF1B family DNA helicase RecD2 n=1 Tax=Emergencia timonensis TaxID=1776384 RepID=UPI001D0745A3|nr:ATP-dependent RecD-like DNA helicase [Emergencia timonensis]MBS6177786.1 ATP-dependent RecD-like DNA helicase [Clostridiales bacterium]MCB6477229.1 ATP-dependent RecD-like DNA helicase [Emergencia timonensis]